MTTTLAPRPSADVPTQTRHGLARWGLLTELEHPRQIVANLGPNWFASVMGTGIVAISAATLPVHVAGLHEAATAMWALTMALFVALTAATVLHWRWYAPTARSHAHDPVMAHFYGAVPMAIMTVGAATVLSGRDVTGLRAAVDADWVLWLIGTALGLACTLVIPYLLFTQYDVPVDGAFGGWLMPIVPPMVSAATGALLVPYAPSGQARSTMVLSCYAMFGMSLLCSVIVITLIWYRLAIYAVEAARMVPTLWIVLGPVGQSITAANQLGSAVQGTVPAPYAGALQALGVAYGAPVWGFAALWFALAAAITVRTARAHLPFSLTWWSFTFPVGTCVTGTSALALRTGAELFRAAAVALFVVLVGAWLMVAARTALGSLRGRLFLPVGAPAS